MSLTENHTIAELLYERTGSGTIYDRADYKS